MLYSYLDDILSHVSKVCSTRVARAREVFQNDSSLQNRDFSILFLNFSATCFAVDSESNVNTKRSTSSRRIGNIGLGWSNFCWENSKWLSSSSSHFVLPHHLAESHKDTSTLHVRRDQPIKDCRPRNLNSVHLESNFFPSLHLKRF